MPRGDYITRNSFYEALCAGTIPVVFDADYFKHCAFNDIIDYSTFVTTLSEADLLPQETTNALIVLRNLHNETSAATRLYELGQVGAFLSCPSSLHKLHKSGHCAFFVLMSEAVVMISKAMDSLCQPFIHFDL